MRVTVLVRPKDGILDPQGEAVQGSLRKLGFAVGGARVGRLVDLEVDAPTPSEAKAQVGADVQRAAREPADRELRDRGGRSREPAGRGSP